MISCRPLRQLSVALCVIALTLLSYRFFPGHTWLQADTQIYLPILERLWDPGVLANDPVAQRPHVAFTIYDEVALLARRLSGLDFRTILVTEQLVFRALGILGVYWLAAALGLSRRSALLVGAAYSLGASVVGPSVLTLEYEPVPRGFAAPLILLALGLVGQGRDLAAGCAATLAFLYHPPTAAAFWAVYFVIALWPSRPAVMSRRVAGLIPLAAGVVILFVLSRAQPGMHEPQMLFDRLDETLEKLQRLRAPYNWVGTWESSYFRQYVLLWLVSLGALWRLRRAGVLPTLGSRDNNGWQRWPLLDLEFFLVGLPLAGMLAIPASYFLLDRLKLALISQLQPTRNLLYVMALAGILAAVAAAKAGERGEWWESLLWLVVVYAIPAHTRLLQLVTTGLWSPLSRWRMATVALLAACTAAAMQARLHRRRWTWALWVLALLAPYFTIPTLGKLQNYPYLHSEELDQLAAWARAQSAPKAVFLFPDAGRELFPGIFRAKALRPVYVDWKGGGQVNFLKGFAYEWWQRWQHTMEGGFRVQKLPRYKAAGVDYLVLRPPRKLPAYSPVFQNARFLVYRLK